MQELDRVFNGDDVSAARGIYLIDYRREGGRLSGARRTGDEDQPAPLLRNPVYYGRQTQFRCTLRLIRNNAQNNAHGAALLKNVRAKSSHPADTVGNVHF